jgi:membrane associated rhomboid family serine protease
MQWPIATIGLACLTAVVSIVALRDPALLALLQRHPDATHHLLSWHLLSPLLVHSEWAALVFNLAGLVIVGAAVERRYGAFALIALYVAGGIVGELFGIRWQPIGAGNSIATFALVGALMSTLVGARAMASPSDPSFASLFAAEWALVYTGLEMFGVKGAVVAAVLFAPLSALVARARARAYAPPRLGALLAGGTLVLSMFLSVLRDIHGPPLIAGAIGGLLLRRIER